MGLGDIDVAFAWRVALGDIDAALRCFCVAAVALMALGWLWWRAWSSLVRFGRRWLLRGRQHLVTSTVAFKRGNRFCVAGVALSDIDAALHCFCVAGVALMALPGPVWAPWAFAWQTWHWVNLGLRNIDSCFCVAGVALIWHLAWQAWHLVTSTFVLCGKA